MKAQNKKGAQKQHQNVMFSPDHSNLFPPPLKLRSTFSAGTPMWRRKLLQSSSPGSNYIIRLGAFSASVWKRHAHQIGSLSLNLCCGKVPKKVVETTHPPIFCGGCCSVVHVETQKTRNIFRFCVGHRHLTLSEQNSPSFHLIFTHVLASHLIGLLHEANLMQKPLRLHQPE